MLYDAAAAANNNNNNNNNRVISIFTQRTFQNSWSRTNFFLCQLCQSMTFYFSQTVSVQLLFSSHLVISVTVQVQVHKKFYFYFKFKFLTNFTFTSRSSVQIYFNFYFWMSNFLYSITGLSNVFVQFQKNLQFKRLYHMPVPIRNLGRHFRKFLGKS